MEDTLREREFNKFAKQICGVLILVVMEDTLRAEYLTYGVYLAP